MENIRVLLVDDEERFRSTIAKRLQRRGISCQQAGSGEQCLAALEQSPVDVVVLDVKMPGMDGIEALGHIKQKYKKTEVIMLTGHATTRDGVEGIKSGAFDYLTKPIELEHLFGKIKQARDKVLREEEKQMETKFRAEMEQQMIATERLAALGTLAAGVAHEINNPLAIIRESAGYMELLLQKEEMQSMPRRQDFEKVLGKIENSIDRARRITHQLLGMVKKPDFIITEVNLQQLMEEAVQLINHEATGRNVAIERDMDPSLKTIFSDPYQLRQVFINLLTNALHATGPQGTITLAILDMSEQVVLKVEDTGQGIPKENLDKIFEPFFSTKSPGKGTGLGLFVTRGIVEKLGGTIEVESNIGSGTCFVITLPRHHEIAEQAGDESTVNWVAKIKSRLQSDKKNKGGKMP